jgi:hypothetical protein
MPLDTRAQGIALLRDDARAKARVNVHKAHMELLRATKGLLDDFRMQFNPPGVRYWESYSDETPPRRAYYTTLLRSDDDTKLPDNYTIAELSHVEYLSRQGMGDTYDEDEL